MRGLNKAEIIGLLGNDPEIKYTNNGTAIANLSVATNDGWKDKATGQQQERTEWHRVVAFKHLAETMGTYLKKGSKVYISGRIQTRSWEKDGITRYSTEIVANELIMLDSKGNAEQPKDHVEPKPTTDNNTAGDGFHDEIPFAPSTLR